MQWEREWEREREREREGEGEAESEAVNEREGGGREMEVFDAAAHAVSAKVAGISLIYLTRVT